MSHTTFADMRSFFEKGSTHAFSFRKEQLRLFRQVVLEHEQAIYDALYADLKKSPEEVWATETGLLLQEINYALKHLRKWMQPQKVRTNLLNLPSRSRIYPSAKGVVLIIGTWNFPLQLLLIPVVGAIAAGNCVVLKPSEHAPATASLIEEMMKKTFPAEFLQVVQGDGAAVIPDMLNSFRFDHIFYTGSTAVGKAIYQMAAKTLTPVTLELGGKDPCVVEADANLKVAARRIGIGKFSNAGQMCVSPDYVLVHETVKELFLQELKSCIRKFYGDDASVNDNYGKIINSRQFDRLTAYLSQGKIVYGGQHDRERLYIAPTIMEDITPGAGLLQEEIFGPILPVFTFKNREEALRMIERNSHPLSFYLFTRNPQTQKEWMTSLPFGNGCINNTAWQFTNHNLPFGGIGTSGMGGYHGKHSFEVFTYKKAVMKTPTWFDPAIKYPPFQGKLKLFKRIIR
jgi:aldehyde dehydrogenase (NAD+)